MRPLTFDDPADQKRLEAGQSLTLIHALTCRQCEILSAGGVTNWLNREVLP